MSDVYVYTSLSEAELIARGFRTVGDKTLELVDTREKLTYSRTRALWGTDFCIANEVHPSIPSDVRLVIDGLGKGNYFFSVHIPAGPLMGRRLGVYHFRSASMLWEGFSARHLSSYATAPDWADLWAFIRAFRMGVLLPTDDYERPQRTHAAHTFVELWRQLLDVLRLKLADARHRVEHYSTGRD